MLQICGRKKMHKKDRTPSMFNLNVVMRRHQINPDDSVPTPLQCTPRCVPGSINVAREPERNTRSQAPPPDLLNQSLFKNETWDTYTHWGLRSAELQKRWSALFKRTKIESGTFQIKGGQRNLTAKCNMLSWIGSWDGGKGRGQLWRTFLRQLVNFDYKLCIK